MRVDGTMTGVPGGAKKTRTKQLYISQTKTTRSLDKKLFVPIWQEALGGNEYQRGHLHFLLPFP